MIKWIRKNWLLFAGFIAVILLIGSIDGYVSKRNHKRDMRANNRDIEALKQDRKASDKRADTNLERAYVAEEEARLERVEKEKYRASEARLEKEKRGLKARIAALPPSKVVVHMIQIIQVAPEEITLRDEGVLFTLSAARTNLEELERFTLIERQYSKLKMSFAKCESSEQKLLVATIEKDKVIVEKDGQLVNWLKAEVKWKENVASSENRGRKARARGRKEGIIVAGVAVIVLLVLKK